MRFHWMDTLRGTAILLIVILHAVELPALLSGVPSPPFFTFLNAAVTPYRMPMLMVLSGMLLGRALSKPPRRYATGKIRTLVWPYAVWVIVYWLVTAPSEFPQWEDWIATSWLWYIFYLAVYFAVAPLLTRLPTVIPPLVFWTVSAIVPDPRWTQLFLFAGYFFAGHAVWQHRALLRRADNGWVVLGGVVAAILLPVGYMLQQAGNTFWIPLRNEELIYAPLTLLGIGALVLVAKRIPDRFTAPLRYFGRNSVVFYLIHFPVQILVTNLLGRGWLWDWRLHVGLGIAIPVGLGMVIVWLRRWPLVDAFFVMPWPGAREKASLAGDAARGRRAVDGS